MSIRLHILSPEGTLVSASVSLVSLPGTLSPFTVLPGHAPIVTSLEKGSIRYVEDGDEKLAFCQLSEEECRYLSTRDLAYVCYSYPLAFDVFL